MGALLQTFTYPRNAFAASAEASAEKALRLLDRVNRNKLLRHETGKVKDESFNDSRLFLAIAAGQPEAPHITPVGARFLELAKQSEVGAWRWLLTRSMWLYSVPNASAVACNSEARALDLWFNFFDMITRLTVHFSALPAPANIVYFDELLPVLDDDENWRRSDHDLFQRVLRSRDELQVTSPSDHAELLSELEPRYSISRDYLNTVFRKAFGQSGLFTIMGIDKRVHGIRLDPATYENPVLAERLRFVLDHPRIYRPSVSPVTTSA